MQLARDEREIEREVAFFDEKRGTWGGQVTLKSDNGNVALDGNARIDVSGAAGADGGTLSVSAVNGTVSLPAGTLRGEAVADANGQQGKGAVARVDAGTALYIPELQYGWDPYDVTVRGAEIGAGWRFGADTIVKASWKRDLWDVDPEWAEWFPDGYAFAVQIAHSFDVRAWTARE